MAKDRGSIDQIVYELSNDLRVLGEQARPEQDFECWMHGAAALRWRTAWRRPGRSAAGGGRRARGWWRAGRRPAAVGCRCPPTVLRPWNGGSLGVHAAAGRPHESRRSRRRQQRYGGRMDDRDTPPPAVSDAALLRYSIVAQVESLVLGGWPAAAAVRRIAAEPHAAPGGQPERVSVRTPAALVRRLRGRRHRGAGAAQPRPHEDLGRAERRAGDVSAHREAARPARLGAPNCCGGRSRAASWRPT